MDHKNCLLKESFDYQNIAISNSKIQYNQFTAAKIVFNEGAAAIENPFFPKGKLHQKKGEYLTIKAPDFNCDTLLKGKYYVIPLGADLYKVGATFNHKENSLKPTKEGKMEMYQELKKIIMVPFEVIDQEVGLRPTVKDRRPLLGNLQEFENIYFFNGLGTRGLLMAPLLSQQLFEYMEFSTALPKEIDIKRFIS